MAISFIQAASANTTNVAISSTLAGDLILVFAYRSSSTTAPSLPAGFTNILTNTSGTLESCRVGYRISAGGDTSSGTWTNATNVVCLVYRGARTVGASGSTQGSSTTVSYPTITLQDSTGNSWVAGMAGAKSATAGMTGTTAALVSNRTHQTTVNGLDTNGGVTSFAAQSLTVTTSGSWIGASVELRAAPPFEEDIFWLQRIAAGIAIVGVLTFPFERFQGGVSQQVNAPSTIDEDFWASSVPSATWQQNQFPQPWPFEQNESPSTVVPAFQPDEDYWAPNFAQNAWQNFVALPIPQDELPTSTGSGFDEDFWQNPATPQFPQQNVIQVTLDSGDGIQNISFGLDEDYSPEPIVQAIAAFSFPQQFFFEQNESATLSGEPDEDFPGPLPAPQPLTIRPFSPNDVEEIPAGFLHGQPDEDYWQNPVPPITYAQAVPAQWEFEQNESPNLHGEPDENFWANPSPPALWAPLNYPQQWMFDEEIPAGFLFGQADEDYWQNPTPPATWPNLAPSLWTFEQDESPTLSGQPDEDYWQNPVPPVPGSMFQPLPLLFDPSETVPAVSGNPDEDYWRNPSAPVVWPNTAPLPWQFEQNEPAGSLYGVPNDEPWLNPVLPSVTTKFVLPFPAIDPDFVGYTPDEASAAPVVFPSAGANLVPSPWFDQVETVVAPTALDDGGGFVAPLPQTSALRAPVPWFDQGREVSIYTIDEDFWIPPQPWPNPFTFPPQWEFSLEERPTPGQPPEDYWQNPTGPITYSHIWPQQWEFDTQDPQYPIVHHWMLCFDILNTPGMVAEEGNVELPAMESFSIDGQSEMVADSGQVDEPVMASDGLVSTPQMISLGGWTQQL